MIPLSNERLAELIRGWHNVAALDAGAKDVPAALRELQSARERIAGLESALRDLLGQVEQGAELREMRLQSPSLVEAMNKASAALASQSGEGET